MSHDDMGDEQITVATSETQETKHSKARKELLQIVNLEGLGIGLAIFAVMIALFGYFTVHTELTWFNVLNDFYANVSSELVSIVITVLVLDGMNRRRQDAQEKIRLIAMLGSNENVVVRIAVAELKARGWDKDGTLQMVGLGGANLQQADLRAVDLQQAYLGAANLQQAYLMSANLQQAHLEEANLQGARLWSADLQQAHLRAANLQRADLRATNLQRADLRATNLQRTNLRAANLQQADLGFADLQQADLRAANLQQANLLYANLQQAHLDATNLQDAFLYGANMAGVMCDEKTILPNGEKWTSDVNWSRFGAVEFDDPEEFEAYLASLWE